MNERIVKLITEADAYASTIAEKYVPECGEVNYLWEDAFRKKFAELIINKCAMIGNYAYDGGEYPGRMIREYFGVEQNEFR